MYLMYLKVRYIQTKLTIIPYLSPSWLAYLSKNMEISDVKAVKVNDSSMKVPQKVPHFKVGTSGTSK